MLLQFKEPVTKEYRKNISDKGVKFISYIPENAWIVKNSGNKGEIISDEKVRYLVPYNSGFKIDPQLEKNLDAKGDTRIRVEFFDSAERPEEIVKDYGNLKGKFGENIWRLDTSYNNITDIAEEKHIRWISPKTPDLQTFNYDSRDLIWVNQLQTSPYNLNGDGLTAAVWDSGWAGKHDDLNYTGKRVVGDKGEDCGDCKVKDHGTHVAGTMLGGGILDNALRGMAPDARLATYEWPDPYGPYTFLEEIEVETEDSINSYSSIISQNSWGFTNESNYGKYEAAGQTYDSIIANENSNVNGVINTVFSAGNNRNKQILDYNTTSPPSTGKNIITVGAVDDTADMTAYSSWGPTDDGRIKPTVVANGGDCYQIRSTLPGNNYGDKCGTSMAAPAVSGAAILLNEKYNESYGNLPKPATVKASLIHTAKDLGREGPDYKFGWGLVNATRAINYVEVSDEGNLIKRGSLSQDGTDTYSVEVPQDESVKFTLVWSDYPGTSGSGKALINDLDLVVNNGNGERQYPWTLDWAGKTDPAKQDSPDRTNPVEQVYVGDTNTTEYSITVDGYDIPQGPQDYTLLMTSKEPELVPPNLTVESPLNETYGEIPDFNLSSNQSLEGTNYSIDGGQNYSLVKKNDTYFFNTSAVVDDGTHEAVFWGKNTFGNVSSEKVFFTLDTEPPTLNIQNPVNQSDIGGSFNVNSTYSDSVSGVENVNISLRNDSGTLTSFSGNNTIDSSIYSDGDYKILFRVEDSAGNLREKFLKVTFDNTPPNIDIKNPEEASVVSTPFNVSAHLTDLTNIVRRDYEISNATGVQKSGGFNSTVTQDLATGDYNVSFEAEDKTGNIENKTVGFSVTGSVNLTVESPDNITYSETPDFNLSSNVSLEDAKYSIKGSRNYSMQKRDGKFFYNTSAVVENGSSEAVFWANDSTGKWFSEEVMFTLDNEKPSVTPLSPDEESNISGDFEIKANYSDSYTEVVEADYTISNESFSQDGILNDTYDSINLADGDYRVYYNATDEVSNTESERINITVDNEKPSASISKPVDEFFGDNLDIEYNVDDNVSGVESSEASLVNESGTQASFSENISYDSSSLEDGNYTLEINVTDYAENNVSVEKSLVKDTKEPDVDILLDERNVTVPFDVEASWNDSSGIDYSRLRLWNGSGTLNLTDLNTSISRRDLNGSYNASFEVKDNAGNLFNETLELNITKTKMTVFTPSKEFYRQTPVFNASYPAEVDDAYVEIDGQNYTLNKDGEYLTAEPELENGSYQASFNVESYGEKLVENTSFTVDSEKPSINIITPVDDYNTSGNFDIKLEVSDDFSSIENSTYTIDGVEKDLNDTVDVSQLTDGEYTIKYNVSDSAGNYKITNRNITIDREDPVLTDSTPVNNSNLSSGFTVSSSWDDLTGIKDTKTLLYNETFSSDNSSFDTEDLSDGTYNLSFWAKDFADNSINVSQFVTLDTSAPSISSVAPSNEEIISNESSIEAFVQDGTSGVKDRNLSIYNDSGIVRSFNSNSTWNSSELADGKYTTNFSASDFSRNTKVKTTEFTIDNEKPEINLNLSDLEQLKNRWQGPGNVSSTCEDAGTGIQSFNGTEIEINQSRNLSIECTDKTGKKRLLERNISIDNYNPIIENITPSNGSDVEQEFDIEASVLENESGLDSELSDFSATGGTLSTSLENDSINFTFTEASGTVEFLLNMSDRAGRNSVYTLEYSAPAEEENNDDDDSSGGGGGGGGFSLPPDNEEENQTSNNTQEENNTSEKGDKLENKTISSNNSIKVNLEEKKEINVEEKRTSISSVKASGSGEATFNVVKVEESKGPEETEVYETVDMDFEGENISETNVSFKVNNSWIEERDIERHEVSLYRKNSSRWDRLETRPKETGLNKTTFTAKVPDFSRFSIAASRSSDVESEEASLQGEQNTQEDESQNKESEDESQSSGSDISIVDMLIIFLFVLSGTVGGVVGYRHYRRRKMKESMEELRDMVGFDKELILMINEAETQLESGNYGKASEKMGELTEKISKKKQT